MNESFGEYIGYIIFFLIFVLPRILKFLGKKRPEAKTPSIPTLKDLIEGQLEGQLEGQPLDIETAPSEEETAYLEAEIQDLHQKAANLLQRTEDIEHQVTSRGKVVARILPVIASNLKEPIAKTLAQIKRLQTGAVATTEFEILQIRAAIARHEKGYSLVSKIVGQRLHPGTSGLLNTLDTGAKDCLLPFMVHARRLGIPYSTHFAVTVAETPGFDAANILPNVAPLVVDQKMADLPRSWVNLVSDIGLDVFHSTPNLPQQLAMDLGTMPPPLSLRHYGDTRALIQGLAGAWLPRLFADVGGAVQLGPAYVAGLVANVATGQDEQNALVAPIGGGEATPPAHVRVFAALRTIARMGFADESRTYWEIWRRRLNFPKEIVVRDRDGAELSMSSAAVLDVISRVVDYLFKEPMSTLGGYPLSAIPSLICNDACITRMRSVAAELAEGHSVNAPGRIIMGAALLAVEKTPTAERRIGSAALESLAGKSTPVPSADISPTGRPTVLSEVVRSPELALRAMALGAALAPRNSRFMRR